MIVLLFLVFVGIKPQNICYFSCARDSAEDTDSLIL